MNVGRWAQQGGGGGGEEEERKFIQNKPVNEADSERDRATPVRKCIPARSSKAGVDLGRQTPDWRQQGALWRYCRKGK